MSETLPQTEPATPEEQRLFEFRRAHYGNVVIPWSQRPEAVEAASVSPPEVKKLLETPASEMIDVALMDRLVPDIYGLFDERRGVFISKYPWTPYSEAELTAAIGEDHYQNPGLISYILAAKERGGLSAVRKVMKMVDGIQASSVSLLDIMREAKDIHSGEFIPRAVRGNEAVQQVLAREVLARNSLNLFEWPHHYLERTKRIRPNPKIEAKLLAITEGVGSLDDEQILTLCQKTFGHLLARAEFWATQNQVAKTHADTQDIISAAESHV